MTTQNPGAGAVFRSAALVTDPAIINRSWQRCRQAGLLPEHSREGPHFSGAQLRAAADRRGALLAQARPIIQYMYGQIKDSGCVLLLSDEQGFLLDALGDAEFCSRAAQVALTPGACWTEEARGTNAVGTVLAEAQPIVINGSEHFLRSNSFLSCAAAPLTEPGGRLAGVIDISCDSRRYHPHTFGLVRAAARMIEDRMFEMSFLNHLKLRFQHPAAGPGGPMEGAIALAEDGLVIGANQTGFALLGLGYADIGNRRFAEIFHMNLNELLELDRHAQGRPVALRLPRGQAFYVSVEPARLPPALRIVPPPPPKADQLAELDTGDERIAKAISQLRRVLGQKIPILLQGETGAGKDFFARAIHASGPRAAKPFVAVNCAALPESLIESELFGHAPGAFTGAKKEGAVGRIREAHGGTLFLDEIGDMPLTLQTRLLRVLEDGVVTPIGGKPVPVDFLLISATHADFKARLAAQTFRSDLFYRLNGFTVCLPAARERSDLPALVKRILAPLAAARGQQGLRLSADLEAAFGRYYWPGNLRELASMLRTACLMLEDGENVLQLHHLSEEGAVALQGVAPKAAPVAMEVPAGSLREKSDVLISAAVTAAGGNIAAAARNLGISRNTLYRRMAAGQNAH
jgi:transcriptional regulator of acetoin/glycerol metabolism